MQNVFKNSYVVLGILGLLVVTSGLALSVMLKQQETRSRATSWVPENLKAIAPGWCAADVPKGSHDSGREVFYAMWLEPSKLNPAVGEATKLYVVKGIAYVCPKARADFSKLSIIIQSGYDSNNKYVSIDPRFYLPNNYAMVLGAGKKGTWTPVKTISKSFNVRGLAAGKCTTHKVPYRGKGEGKFPHVYSHAVQQMTVCTKATPTAIPTPKPGNTILNFDLLFHGIGNGGDNVNPKGVGNPNPLHPKRTITVEVFNSQNALVGTKNGQVTYASAAGGFKGSVDFGTLITSGAYTVKVKTDQFLKALVPGILNLKKGVINILPVTSLITGDVNNDNKVNILDYNLLMGCYSDLLPAISCDDEKKLATDINDDGNVNQVDYNLFIREISNLPGQ